MRIHFKIPYFTRWGQRIFVTGNIPELGNDDFRKAFPLTFQGHEDWIGDLECSVDKNQIISYTYLILNEESGRFIEEWGNDRTVEILDDTLEHYFCFDRWNSSGSIENVFMSSPFQEVLLKDDAKTIQPQKKKKISHVFQVKAPFVKAGQVVCIIGNCKELGGWKVTKPVLMTKSGNAWKAQIWISTENEIHYKYGVFDENADQFLFFEEGPDRFAASIGSKSLVQANDGFLRMDNQSWKGAGVGLPVFSIRTRHSFGAGDFGDLKLLVDWAEKVGLKLIQLLPLNDTNGTHTDLDVLPYAAISAFALNPLYLNLPAMGKLPENNSIQTQYLPKQAELNAKPLVSYLEVVNFKIEYARQLYKVQKRVFLKDPAYLAYFEKNRFWLIPYAAYCVLRDKYGTNDYRQWKDYATFDEAKINEFSSESKSHFDEIAVHYFVQYHLHLQLSCSAKYAHERGVILKGDIPIGVNKNSVDTWVRPELFHMDMNAGAPPDMFAVKGQNWGLPTYNWEVMKQNNFDWWKKRFEQMADYFDTFRIDHILGFFRIWQIPTAQEDGIMGHLNPSIPIYVNEFAEKGIWFDYTRFCKPYITDQILWDWFGNDAAWVKTNCLRIEDGWVLRLKEPFTSQHYVEQLYVDGKISEKIKWGLFDIISNVLFFEVEGSNGMQYYPRYGMHRLRTYQELDEHTKRGLDELYIHYYYHRQDANWYQSGMDKLPALKRATNMMICGEDLGMMTQCVTDVMKELGILSLEVQRAPKSNKLEFAHPNNAPYLSVVTPSTHDMSTIRGWWEEDRSVTQRFYNQQLGHWGEAPYFCEWWISRDVVLQHLYSPAMWSVFQMQDLLGISPKLRRENPHDERINVPSNSKHSWRYRMHIHVEDLLDENEFNDELRNFIRQAGR
ncbi:MAG: 4-alpha-glucanotransferase [Paludibacteraceae bacterium]